MQKRIKHRLKHLLYEVKNTIDKDSKFSLAMSIKMWIFSCKYATRQNH